MPPMADDHPPQQHHDPDAGVIGTMQSLIVAFVLAMTFRGFVAEGFVIPTGSMAPTLLGQHYLVHSHITGSTFPVGVAQQEDQPPVDPMLGPNVSLTGGLERTGGSSRAGDRILVLKGLYSFSEPKRWDVIVFKNPTDPRGEAGNYIKRLVGLPNETIWIADGDVFAKRADEEEFRVQRKPEHIQRALWQPIHNSDYTAAQPQFLRSAQFGSPWIGNGWDTSGRAYRNSSSGPSTLHWNNQRRALDDWTAYNMLTRCTGFSRSVCPVPVSDLRVSAGMVFDDDAQWETAVSLEARGHVYEFAIESTAGVANGHVRYRGEDDQDWIASDTGTFDAPPAGRVLNVEFWHVDQALSLYVNGKRIAHLEYEWAPDQRKRNVSGRDDERADTDAAARPPELRWHFNGSQVTLHRVRVDRDLYYRSNTLGGLGEKERPTAEGYEDIVAIGQPAYGTHPDNLAVLGPDHFFMLGDNSQASLDSRLWKNPHPVVAHQIDDAPFVVHRKLLLGKAWVVYFPAPLRDGFKWSPDFGRLRYIR